MATKKKRKTTSQATARKRTSRGKRTSSPKRITQKKRAQLNQIWAFVSFFFALLTFLALFRVDAGFVNLIGNVFRGAIGTGFIVLPFALVMVGVLLIISRGKPIKGRVIATLLIPYFVAAVAHSLVGTEELSFSAIVNAENSYIGGGVLAGYPAALLVSWISPIATVILFVVAALFDILFAFNLTIMGVYDGVRGFFGNLHYEVEYEEEEEPEEKEETPKKELPKPSRRKRPIIDIPLDGEKVPEPEAMEEPEEEPAIFPPANVKTPAEVILGEEKPEAEEISPEEAEEIRINEENFTKDILEAIEESEKAEAEKARNLTEAAENMGEPIKEEENKAIYSYPPVSLLKAPEVSNVASASAELQSIGIKLRETVRSFGVDIKVVNIVRGPSVTRFEVQPDAGVKLAKITSLADDIALALGASGVFIAPVPNKALIGIEIPNKSVQVVNISEVIASEEFTKNESDVAFALGKDISGNCIACDIARLPHMLIAGTTGSGKSVCINSIIISILYRSTPEQVRLIMIDPKMVELGVYNGIPHLLVPVVTDPKKAAGALQWAVFEMMKRYKLFSECGVRDMKSYNKAVAKSGEGEPMPSIVIVIDELADLMVVARKDVEDSIMRLSQMARAAGMHLIIATQRPSVDVITGVIKSNIPSRIAFAVASKIESNIILGSMGAEKLIGRGDMLYEPMGASKPTRVQGCFISSDEVEAVVDFVKQGSSAEYSQDVIDQIEKQVEKNEGNSGDAFADDEDADDMLTAAIDIVVESGQASTSMLQRRLKLGYSRAARIIDQMEERGIVGEFEGSKPRKILITRDEWREMKMRREDM
ncbi:MAG: DNA translocase FtsK [Oscillospiraceae bacterium]|nr:DNA translocase FtsK [Oscillospiraceae bacterium]